MIYLFIESTETKYIKLNTKTQNIFCLLNENLHNLTTGTRKQKAKKKKLSVYKSRMLLKKIWVLVFTFMYLVSVDPMDRFICFQKSIKHQLP